MEIPSVQSSSVMGTGVSESHHSERAAHTTMSAEGSALPQMSLGQAANVAESLRKHMRHDVMGRDSVIELVLIALLGDGHILLEDYPGSGKTTLAKALGTAISGRLPHSHRAMVAHRRMQFTPDLLPSDVTGVMVFNTDTNGFDFRPGPIFSHIALVDEINRTTPKVQSALLEAMAEKQVTVDNATYYLSELFFVIATQNPLDAVGTYPLPVAQLDRFLFKVKMKHIDRESELEVMQQWGRPRAPKSLPTVDINHIVAARHAIRTQVKISDHVQACVVDGVRAIREDKRCVQGASTRSLVQAVSALQTAAFLNHRDYVSADDVVALVKPLLSHRLSVIPGVEDADDIIETAFKKPIDELSKHHLS